MALAFALLMPSAWAADVQLSQFDDNPDPAIRGGTFTYTSAVQNNAADTASDVVLSVPLPATTIFVSVTAGEGCSHNGGTPGTVTCNFGSLLGSQAGGPIKVIDIVVRTTGATPVSVSTTGTATTSSADTNGTNNTLSQNTTISNGADLSVAVSGAPPSVPAGGNVTWTVNSQNLGPNDAAGITVTNTLPTNMSFVSASGGGWSCSNVAQVVTCTRAALASGVAAPAISIVGQVTGAVTGTLTDAVSITSTTGEPVPGNNTATADVTVTAGTDLAITHGPAIPDPALSAQNVTLTLRPRNNGPFPATGLTVQDTLPAGFTFVSAVGTGWACSESGGIVDCTRANYAVGATDDITITLTAPTVLTPTAYSNTATIAGGPTDSNAANNTTTLNAQVVPDGVDLSVAKSKGPNPVAQGSPITSTIVIHNNGPQSAASGTITVTDTIDPARESYGGVFSGSNWVCTFASPVINCVYNAALASGNNAETLSITTTALAANGAIVNNAAVTYSGAPGDWNSSNDTIGASVTVTATGVSPDLRILKSATTPNADTTLTVDEAPITYTLTVNNLGPGNADGVVITDNIPGHITGLTGVTALITANTSTATFNCTTGSTVTCTQTGGLLEDGTQVVVTVTVTRPLLDGTRTNTATVNSTTLGDPSPGNNTAQATVVIDPIADIQMQSKVVTPASVRAGTTATYVLTFRNNGPSTAANVTVADTFTIPGGGDTGFTLISMTPSKGTCTLPALPANIAITTAFNCAIGSMTSGESQTITIVVRPNWMALPPGVRTLNNTATMATTTPENGSGTNNGNNSASASLDIQPAQLDALINDSDTAPAGPDPLGYDQTNLPSNTITYFVRASNQGPSLASGVYFTFEITPPAGKTATFMGDKATAGGAIGVSVCDQVGTSITGAATLTLTCTLPAPGQLATSAAYDRYLVFRVDTVPATNGDTYSTVATVFTNETDSNAGNNVESETTTVRVRSDISLTKVASIDPVQLRQPFNWTLTVTNIGPGDSQLTALTDTLPAGMEFSGAAPSWTNNDGGSGSCSTAGATLTCALGLLRGGFVATVTVPVRMTAYPLGGTIQNCSTATTSEVDPNAANNVTRCATLTVQKSSLAGRVYGDRNNNGVIDGTETGIAGVNLTLVGTDAYGNAVNVPGVAAADGTFLFDNLSPANPTGYVLTEVQPASWIDGIDTVGSSGGVLASVAGNDVVNAIVLPGNTAATNYVFGETGGSLAGHVYYDANNNGVRDVGEQGIQGVTLNLTGIDNNGNALARTTVTLVDGTYEFVGLPASNGAGFSIAETQPVGYTTRTNTPGTLGGNVAADTINNIVVSSAGLSGINYDFGETLAVASAQVSGRVWLDLNHDRLDNDGTNVPNWIVEIIKRVNPTDTIYTVIGTTVTDANGNYSFTNLLPNNAGDATDRYEIRFRHPQNSAVYGQAVSLQPGVDLTYGTIRNLQLNPGDNVLNQNLPLDPSGVVYDAVTRAPVPGATVTINGPPGFDAATHLVGGTGNQTQTTANDGLYQFLLLPGAPAGTYTLSFTVPPGYVPGISTLIPVCTGTLTVGAVPDPALIQSSDTAPGLGTPAHTPAACALVPGGALTTQYFLSFGLTPGVSADVLNNHIPIDPVLGGAIIVTKNTPLVNVTRGDLVPYTVTATNTLAAILANINVVDRLPPGFRYRLGSATLNGVALEPAVTGRDLVWANQTFAAGEVKTFRLMLVVGAGVGEGEYTNQAWALNNLIGTRVSNVGSATVRVIPDPTFDCSDLIGKVFDDQNANGYEDQGEPGIANVRVVTVRGLLVTTDAEGRFHVACADIPQQDRGSNFVMKLDERTLPSGYRLTTENPRDVRTTRGKMVKLNFGATVHRVVRLDLNAQAFVADDSTELQPQWTQQLEPLLKKLQERPSVLRIAYTRSAESEKVAQHRLDAVADQIRKRWRDGKRNERTPLIIETESGAAR